MYVNSFLDVSVHFKSKTNLLFIRERIIIPVYVNSLSECAMRCFVQLINVFPSLMKTLICSVNEKQKATFL